MMDLSWLEDHLAIPPGNTDSGPIPFRYCSDEEMRLSREEEEYDNQTPGVNSTITLAGDPLSEGVDLSLEEGTFTDHPTGTGSSVTLVGDQLAERVYLS